MAEAAITGQVCPHRAGVIGTAVRPLASLIELSSCPHVRGKFLYLGREKFWVRGVTYGTFAPDDDNLNYPPREVVEADFASMVAQGINTIRLYTVPPRWLLDTAYAQGLRVLVGLPWEQHITFLDSKRRAKDIVARVREGVRACAGHPAILCFAVGNEIPASIVRWYGPRRVEAFLRRLYRAAKSEDPRALITYVNYPTTEYLDLSFFDLYTFNVYLEDGDRFSAYLKRLHHIARDKPVVLAEVGLDSLRHGEAKQAEVLEWQIRASFAEGCCGLFIFAWTDEWHRGGYEIADWNFGLTTRQRKAKPALEVVRRSFETELGAHLQEWPRISVVVCSLNGAQTISETLEACSQQSYPDYEVIVVSDGSTDATPIIARDYDVRLFCTENQGLSAARNLGLREATGEIVAYVDDDAYPDKDWLYYIASAFSKTNHVGIGGPNLLPLDDGDISVCVYNSPGGPSHVMLDDDIAEHIPGCNMAFRVRALKAIGGFDPQFRQAGDDVDICWRLQERGWSIGFSHGALVWHHRRNSIVKYFKQQIGYGKAEALLEKVWPAKYNGSGHLSWKGRIYSHGDRRPLSFRGQRIYHGTWGTSPFQSLYDGPNGTFADFLLMPEWYLVLLALTGLALHSLIWAPLWIFAPLAMVAVAASILQAWISARKNLAATEPLTRARSLRLLVLTTVLHLVQPAARLYGRLKHGLTPWRQQGKWRSTLPRKCHFIIWDENWNCAENRLAEFEGVLKEQGAILSRGGPFDRWDIQVRGGLFGASRALLAIEEHGAGQQLIRFNLWPHVTKSGAICTAITGGLTVWATIDHSWVAVVFALIFLGSLWNLVSNCGRATAALLGAVRTLGGYQEMKQLGRISNWRLRNLEGSRAVVQK